MNNDGFTKWWEEMNAQTTEKNKDPSKSFCIIPWIHMNTWVPMAVYFNAVLQTTEML